jgi:hypothetical protein
MRASADSSTSIVPGETWLATAASRRRRADNEMLVEPSPLPGIEFVVGVGVFSNRGVFGYRV